MNAGVQEDQCSNEQALHELSWCENSNLNSGLEFDAHFFFYCSKSTRAARIPTRMRCAEVGAREKTALLGTCSGADRNKTFWWRRRPPAAASQAQEAAPKVPATSCAPIRARKHAKYIYTLPPTHRKCQIAASVLATSGVRERAKGA